MLVDPCPTAEDGLKGNTSNNKDSGPSDTSSKDPSKDNGDIGLEDNSPTLLPCPYDPIMALSRVEDSPKLVSRGK